MTPEQAQEIIARTERLERKLDALLDALEIQVTDDPFAAAFARFREGARKQRGRVHA